MKNDVNIKSKLAMYTMILAEEEFDKKNTIVNIEKTPYEFSCSIKGCTNSLRCTTHISERETDVLISILLELESISHVSAEWIMRKYIMPGEGRVDAFVDDPTIFVSNIFAADTYDEFKHKFKMLRKYAEVIIKEPGIVIKSERRRRLPE